MPVQSGQYLQPDDLLRALFVLPSAPYIPIQPEDFYPSEGVEIDMNGAGITDAASRTPILGTTGIGTCMGFAVFNEDSKTGGLAHLASEGESISQESKGALVKLLSEVRGDASHKLEVRIMGPLRYSRTGFEELTEQVYLEKVKKDHLIMDVLKILNETPDLRILSADFGGKPCCSKVGIDTRHWKEGLLKGSGSSGLSPEDRTTEERKQLYTEGFRHVVDIENLRPAPHYRDGLFDARVDINLSHTAAHSDFTLKPTQS